MKGKGKHAEGAETYHACMSMLTMDELAGGGDAGELRLALETV